MSKFEDLLNTVETHQKLAAENYDRIRGLAEELRNGMCAFMGSKDGVCVHLVPPVGPFEPKAYGDGAFSVAPRGFRPLGPISFGFAVRVTKDTDWLRLALECRKVGDVCVVEIEGGSTHDLPLPLSDNDPQLFYEHLYNHIMNWFETRIERYRDGDYGTREIGFDFANREKSLVT